MALETTTETTPVTLKALKLEDYDEITLDPTSVQMNRVKREITFRSNQTTMLETGDDDEDEDGDGEMNSTTLESSTIPTMTHEVDATNNDYVSTSSTSAAAASQQHYFYIPPSNHFPYPPSRNPSAQYVTITHSPPHRRPSQQPFSYFPPPSYQHAPYRHQQIDFYPSQPDFNRPCISPLQNRFTPIINDNWANYHKWRK